MPAPKNANRELTTREKETYEAYKRHLDEHGVPPTHRQLAVYLGVYLYAAQRLLKRLVEKGWLKEKPITMRMRVLLPTAKAKRDPVG
jgi:SOS-response transcriptional repressor LexA